MRLIALAALAIATSFAFGAPVRADEYRHHFNVAPGTCSGPIAVAGNNTPVTFTAANYEPSDIGVGHVTILRKSASPAALIWAGEDYQQGPERGSAIDSDPPGVHIMYMDSQGWVDVETAPNTHVKVCNSSSNPANGTGWLLFTLLGG